MASRYIVGIDLGTTNCALSYLDTFHCDEGVKSFAICQWEREGVLGRSLTLPSFCYLPPKSVYKHDALRLPQHPLNEQKPISFVVGRLAKEQQSFTPDRVIHSAKSWLCHPAVDARQGFLPWHSESIMGEERLSPVRVSALYLAHLRDCWNQAFALTTPEDCLEQQRVVITVPASFNELASELTLEAAKLAGLSCEHIRLLEEPQAAFYYWQFTSPDAEQAKAKENFYKQGQEKMHSSFPHLRSTKQSVLVCDIGGGTTDFSLLELATVGEEVRVRRVAVSDHLLLGGDNIDLRLAYLLEQKFLEQMPEKKRIDGRQWVWLVGEARKLKELALNSESLSTQPLEREYGVALAATGSQLLATAISIRLSHKELMATILEDFFPLCKADSRPDQSPSGLKEWGLPYARDPRISHHLAAFLKERKVDGLLFAGGSLKPSFIQERLCQLITEWQGFRPRLLLNAQLELAVSQGASWYGAILQEDKGRIGGGYPRHLFVEVGLGSSQQRGYLCILPKGYDSLNPLVIDVQGMQVLIGKPVSFRMYYALEDRPLEAGTILLPGEMPFRPIAGLETTLKKNSQPEKVAELGKTKSASEPLEVALAVSLLENGLLAIDCRPRLKERPAEARGASMAEERWQLRFQVQERAMGQENLFSCEEAANEAAGIKPPLPAGLEAALAKIDALYGKPQPQIQLQAKPSHLLRSLEEALGSSRQNWDLALLRSFWPPLKLGEHRRGRSEAHEVAWLNLVGYALRPGYGDPQDRFRLEELWPNFSRGLMHPLSKAALNQWWILWRRVAGGLTSVQQERILVKIFPAIRQGDALPEVYMLVGALERLSIQRKIQLGSALIKQLQQPKSLHGEQRLWALSRLASRWPLYAGAEAILPPALVSDWCQKVQAWQEPLASKGLAYFYGLAGKMTGYRELDIDDELRQRLIAALQAMKAPASLIDGLSTVKAFDQENHQQLFGESLPAGFIVNHL